MRVWRCEGEGLAAADGILELNSGKGVLSNSIDRYLDFSSVPGAAQGRDFWLEPEPGFSHGSRLRILDLYYILA